MNPTLSLPSSTFKCIPSPFPRPSFPLFANVGGHSLCNTPIPNVTIRASSSSSSSVPAAPPQNHLFQKIKTLTRSSILLAATVSFILKINQSSIARAEVSPPVALTEELPGEVGESLGSQPPQGTVDSPLTEFLESNPESLDALKKLLQQKLENGEDREALALLERIVSAYPDLTEYKFLLARLYNEIGDKENSRRVFDEILAENPLSFEALFENSLLMDRCGEGEAVMRRLEEAVRMAEEEGKKKEARDVKLIIAQMEFLRKDVEGALRSYEELIKEDGSDFRPYFCKGMIFSLVGKDDEAKEMFRKYRELSPRKFDVEGYVRSPLSRFKVFGTDDSN